MQSINTPVSITMNSNSVSRGGNLFGQSIQQAAPVNQLPDSGADFSSHQAVFSRDIKPDTALLSKLHHFAPVEDKARLDMIAKDIGYQKKFDHLMKEKFKSEDYLLSDSCNTLYWGFMNGQLTEEEFLEHYHFLKLIFFFFPKQCEGKLPAGEYDLATEVREITCEDLRTSRDYPVFYMSILPLSKDSDYKGHPYKIFEFYLTRNVQKLLSSCNMWVLGRNDRAPDFQQNHYLFWLRYLDDKIPGIWLSKDKNKIAIGSFSFLSWAVEAGTLNPVKIKPGFGAGNWEALKLMRLEEQHPVALWHPLVSNSLVQPDGYWVGTISHLHDFYHTYLINQLGKEMRQQYLRWDTKIACPRIAFYERFLSGEKTEGDEKFIRIFDGIKYGNQGDMQRWDSDYISKLHRMETVLRPLVDQEIPGDGKIPLNLHSLQHGKERILFNLTFWEMLEINLFLFHAITSKDDELVKEVLGIGIQQYPDVRLAMSECNKAMDETADDSDEAIKKAYLKAHPLAGYKWLIDMWVRALSE